MTLTQTQTTYVDKVAQVAHFMLIVFDFFLQAGIGTDEIVQKWSIRESYLPEYAEKA